ncbi:MAG: hypothetical protein GF329_17010 [Candidatus Lokiarchaeota archaeon]|nr:hypothetical protein [Candidatus Lokiarchaeota archaeon]
MIIVISIFVIVFYFWKYRADKSSLYVYIISGLWNCFIELSAFIFAVRSVDETLLFGFLRVGFPYVQLIMGFYEGGVQCLVAYHLIRAVMRRDKSSLIFSSEYLVITNSIIGLIDVFNIDASSTTISITRREVFSLGSILLLIISFLISFGYFFLKKSITKREKKSFLLWYLFIMVVYFPIFLISHISMNRFIEIQLNGSYIIAPLFDQIAVLYGYGLGFEAAGFFLPIYVILHALNVIKFDKQQKKSD